MSRKPKKGYFVRGQFVAEGSELDLEFKRELKGGLDGPSRTELKRESTELQELGTALLTLRRDLMERLALPDKLVDGLAEAKRITNFEGKRRQMQFIGKQMRLLSPETLQAVREALDIQRLGSAKDTQALHLAEAWRDRLIADDAAVGEWIEHHPQTDIQQLRALVRQARKDAVPVTNAAVSQGLAPRQGRAYRELFKLLKMSEFNATIPFDPVKIGIVSISDRASTGVYEDKGLPALQDWLTRALHNPITFEPRLIPDEKDRISATLIELVDAGCSLVLTTGGTGPALRDVTPEATLAVADKEMPGFGEQMRQISLKFVPTAILSRQVAVIRSQSLIINLPGQPKSIAETLEGLKDAEGKAVVHGIFAAVPYCVDLIGGPYMETKDEVCKAFRPKTAIRPAR
eukprot:gene22533-28667_t